MIAFIFLYIHTLVYFKSPYQNTVFDNLLLEFLPIRRDENDPFIIGFDRMQIATTLPTTPRVDTIDNKTPSMINVNMLDQSD